MVYRWEPGTGYAQGSVVEYEGHKYKIIQPHTSLANWTPPATPALWAKLPEEISSDNCSSGRVQQQQQPAKCQAGNSNEKPSREQQSQKVQVTHEEQQKHWYDIDDKRKKQLEAGGGLAAGLAFLGTGYYAYQSHEKHEEQKKAQVSGLQRWVQDARARAEEFYRNGPKGPVTWIFTNGHNIPQDAIQGGEENGQPIFIARTFHEGSVQVGKAGRHFEQGAVIGYAHKEFQLGVYEVLIGDSRAIRWVGTSGYLKPVGLGCRLVEGGREGNGTPIYVAQADCKGSVCPGKVREDMNGALLPYGGTEKRVKEYRVLAYA